MVTDTHSATSTTVVDLAPSGAAGVAGQAVLFDGFLNHPMQAAATLLLLGRVARHRFYLPPGMIAAKIASSDPVVTTSRDRLRFESFSACCGMALRYDVTPDGMDRSPIRHGTTNIDLTGPTRTALTGIQGIDPLHIRITDETHNAVTFTTLDHTVNEAKVPLPKRWVRGFAEAQTAGACLVQRARISSAEARRFWHTLPRTDSGSSHLYVTTSPRGLRLTGTVTAHAIPLGGPSRLRIIEPLLRYATSLTAYGPPTCTGPGASMWQLDLPGGTLTCAVSPTASRGFSGEGGLLHQLAAPRAARHAEAIADHLADHHDEDLIDPATISRHLGLPTVQVESGLAHLAANGTVGYDATRGGYFHRELPWTINESEALNPRLVAARRLLANGTVTVHPADQIVDVRHGTSHHRVRGHGSNATCTCPWIAQHGTSRGPCKHILAADLRPQEAGLGNRQP